MEVIFQSNDVTIRRMQDDLTDYTLMSRWLTDPDVLTYYHGRDNPYDLNQTIAHYAPRVLREDGVTPCIIEYGSRPIGYLQYYRDDDENPLLDEPAVSEALGHQAYENPYGIDLFIGEPDAWNKGIGTAVLRLFIHHMLKSSMADIVLIDPQTWNKRAIRCYKKCGFTPLTVLQKRELHEGAYQDSLIMAVSAASLAHA